MLPDALVPGPLEQSGHQVEHARRVATGGRGLAGGQADLALGHRHAGEAVHHQYDVLAAVAEVLGDPRGDEGRAQSLDRRRVGRGHHDDGTGESLGAEVVLDELPDLAASLADQRDHRDLGVGAARDHRQQAGLADAGAGHDAEPLTAAAGDQGVEGAHAEPDLVVDPRAAERTGGGVLHRHAGERVERGATVDGVAEAVEDTATQRVADTDLQRSAGAVHRGADGQPGGRSEGQADQAGGAAGDDLGEDGSAALDGDQVAHGSLEAGDPQLQAEQLRDASEPRGTCGVAGALEHAGAEGAHRRAS